MLTAKDIKINGVTKGCSGFLKNLLTGKFAYLNTESGFGSHLQAYLYRTAKNDKDFTGGHNQYCKTPSELHLNLVRIVS